LSGAGAAGLAALGLAAPGRRPEIPGGPQTVAAVLERALAAAPAADALVGRHGRFSYAELDRVVARAAGALGALGVGVGDRVAASLPNDVDIVIAFLATMRLGAIWVGVNRVLAPPEKAYLLRDSGARVCLAEPAMAAQVEAQRATLPELEELVVVEPGEAARGWRALVAGAPEARSPAAAIDPFAPAAIAYTSGTTGHPKGAVHSQHNLLLPGAVAARAGTYGADVRQGAVLPLTILNLMVLAPLVAFQDGSCCVAIDRVDPQGLAEWVRRERVGHFAAVPTIYHDLLTHPDVKPEDLATLRRPEVGGAECPEEFRRLYRERFGAEVTIGYGMTEAPTAVSRSDGAPSAEPGLCGRAVPQVEITIRDEQGRPLPAGEVGEICVSAASSGPWAGVYTPMLGYWMKPGETAGALRDGVYHSGDLGLLAADGNLFIRGRRNELILRGGANVYPAEVERVLQQHPAVAAAAVLGRPDARLGERVAAAVQLAPGARAAAEDLLAHCARELARYKVPDEIRFVAALPRNAMGKVLKRELAPLFGA
jgi:acyl-CoA synthetase (AMP-forming)/AMP-acid ligase II